MELCLTIPIPNGRVEYWLTERVFAVDDKIERNADTWIFTSVGDTDGSAKQRPTIERLSAPGHPRASLGELPLLDRQVAGELDG